jgi:cytochrome P450
MSVTNPVSPAGTVEFDPFSEVFFNDPFNTYRRLRDESPVYHNEKYGFWALSRYEDVEPAMKDCQTYSSARGITLDMYLAEPDPTQPTLIIMMDPPQHTVMRKLVNKVFTPRAIAALEPMIREKITEVANTLDRTAFDVVADFAALFPVEVITTMLGVPPNSDSRSACGWTSNWCATPVTSICLPKDWRPPKRSACSITSWSANVGPTPKTT